MKRYLILALMFALCASPVLTGTAFAHCGMCGTEGDHSEGMSHKEGHDEGSYEGGEAYEDEMSSPSGEETGAEAPEELDD